MSGAGRLRRLQRDAFVSTGGVSCAFELRPPNGAGSEGGAVCRYPGTVVPPPRAGIDSNAEGEEASSFGVGGGPV